MERKTDIDIALVRKAFFIGIGGIGISAIARMCLFSGAEVYGSDMAASEITDELSAEGAIISIGQGFDLIPADADLIVYTIAISHYDPKLMEAVFSSGIPSRSYPEMLHAVTKDKNTIAVSGTHGKTTTTAMIAKILIDAKRDPSVIVGSLLKEYKSNLIVGAGEHFVVEACEYERSFLNINPKVLAITNIEADHLDYYKDLADIEDAFSTLVGQTGAAVACDPSDPSVARVIAGSSVKVLDYAAYLGKVPQLAVAGAHNRKNAACALAVAEFLGIDPIGAAKSVAEFQGTWRRLEMRGTSKDGAIVYDDYAHHPTEIRASLQALRELYPRGEKKITVIFQPHLYSRTKAFFAEFATAFAEADAAYFLPIYFAREEADPTVSSEKLAAAVAEHVSGAQAFATFDDAKAYFAGQALGESDVIVTMGAGEAYKVADPLLQYGI